MRPIAVFGLGYVGGVTAACLAREGHKVIGVDVDPAKVDEINAGRSPVAEPGMDDLVDRVVAEGRLCATVDVEEAVHHCETALVCVGTPSAEDGSVSVTGVESVIDAVGRCLRPRRHVMNIVIRSTLLPGLLEERLGPCLQERSGRRLGEGVRLCNNPEFLREGSAIHDFSRPPLVLVGANEDEAAEAVFDLHRNVTAPRRVTDTRTAALVKYACNAFHAVKVAFANEIGCVAATLGADGARVMQLLCDDRKLNVSAAYLRPGFAFGGSCLPKDLRALVRHGQRSALTLPVLEGVLPSNTSHIRRAVQLIQRLGRRRVGLVGLSFKSGTDDLRESPFVELAQELIGRGFDLRIYDPGVSVARLRGRNRADIDRRLPHLTRLLVEDPTALCGHAEMLVVGCDTHGDDWPSLHPGPILDLRRDLARPTAWEPASDPALRMGTLDERISLEQLLAATRTSWAAGEAAYGE